MIARRFLFTVLALFKTDLIDMTRLIVIARF